MKLVRLLSKKEFLEQNWSELLELDDDEKMSFEDYINMELTIIYSEENQFVESITHSIDMEHIMIVYNVKKQK